MTDYAPVIDNFLIEQGATFARAYPVSGVVMAGATVKSEIRASYDSDVVLEELAVTLLADDPGVPAGRSGVVTITVDAATSWGWAWRTGVWDAILIAADGTVSRIARGHVVVSPGVTRP